MLIFTCCALIIGVSAGTGLYWFLQVRAERRRELRLRRLEEAWGADVILIQK